MDKKQYIEKSKNKFRKLFVNYDKQDTLVCRASLVENFLHEALSESWDIAGEEKKEDLLWILSECWELLNKPWRLWGTLRVMLEKYKDEVPYLDKKDIQDTIDLMKLFQQSNSLDEKVHALTSKQEEGK